MPPVTPNCLACLEGVGRHSIDCPHYTPRDDDSIADGPADFKCGGMRYERWWALIYRGRGYWVRAWTMDEALEMFSEWIKHPVETERITNRRPY